MVLYKQEVINFVLNCFLVENGDIRAFISGRTQGTVRGIVAEIRYQPWKGEQSQLPFVTEIANLYGAP